MHEDLPIWWPQCMGETCGTSMLHLAELNHSSCAHTHTGTKTQKHTQINHKHTWRCIMHVLKGAHGHLTATWHVLSCFGCLYCPTKHLGWRQLDTYLPKSSGIKLKLKMSYVTATFSFYFKEPDEGYKLALVSIQGLPGVPMQASLCLCSRFRWC